MKYNRSTTRGTLTHRLAIVLTLSTQFQTLSWLIWSRHGVYLFSGSTQNHNLFLITNFLFFIFSALWRLCGHFSIRWQLAGYFLMIISPRIQPVVRTSVVFQRSPRQIPSSGFPSRLAMKDLPNQRNYHST